MKHLLILLTLLGFALQSSAQDQIFFENGEKVEAKILEIGITEIRYQRFDNLEGPVYAVKKSTVNMIIYKNGDHEIIKKTAQDGRVVEEDDYVHDDTDYNARKNLVGFNYIALFTGDIQFNYERILFGGKLGVKVPLIFGFGENNFGNYFDNIFTSGLDLNFYPLGQQKVSYYTGPAVRMGQVEDYFYDYYNGATSLIRRNFYGVYITNGINIQPATNFNINTEFGIGVSNRNSFNDNLRTHAFFETGVAVRF